MRQLIPAVREGWMSHVAARVIGDLPGFFSVVDDDWHQDLVGFPVRLMDRGERGLLRVSPEAVVAFRYHDVLDLANQRDVGNMPVEVLAGQSSRRETGGGAHVAAGPAGTAGTERAMFRMLADQAFTHIPPLHRFTRHALSRQLLRRNLRPLEPLAEEIAAALAAGLAGRSGIDFGAHLARPYVARFWGDVIGLTPAESAEVCELMREMSPIFLLERTPAQTAAVDQAASRYTAIVDRAAARGFAAGDNQVITELAADLGAIEVDGKPGSVGSFLAANLFDGFHTVGVAVANALYVLLATGRYGELLRDPGLAPRAFQESLRIAPPLLLTHRYVLSDVVHDGVLLPAGTSVAMLWGSPNLDPEVFADPWRFRWDRAAQPLLTFGGGAHLCPGRTAARMLVETALTTFARLGLRWRLADGHAYQWQPASAMRELVSFPVELA
jgi:cytochrome P450